MFMFIYFAIIINFSLSLYVFFAETSLLLELNGYKKNSIIIQTKMYEPIN